MNLEVTQRRTEEDDDKNNTTIGLLTFIMMVATKIQSANSLYKPMYLASGLVLNCYEHM